MRPVFVTAGIVLMFACTQPRALEMPKVPDISGITKGSVLDKVNKSLSDQQVKDGQFEFKTGKAEFASGNAKRVSGLLKVLSNYSKTLSAIPNLHVSAEGHTDAAGSAESNQ
jgi:outer membrane protein OmpA-like peptidoglycan-associated protein